MLSPCWVETMCVNLRPGILIENSCQARAWHIPWRKLYLFNSEGQESGLESRVRLGVRTCEPTKVEALTGATEVKNYQDAFMERWFCVGVLLGCGWRES